MFSINESPHRARGHGPAFFYGELNTSVHEGKISLHAPFLDDEEKSSCPL